MTPDPKWLEVLKASGWQTGMLALACLTFVALTRFNVIPSEPWMTTAAVAAMLIFTALWLASVGKGALATAPVHLWLQDWFAIRRAKRGVADYIPFMTPREKQIIAYLLSKNQKSFDCASDFGHAASLAGRGFIVVNATRGQHVDFEHVPVKVPDHVWEVLAAHRDQFPYKPELNQGVEVHPWRKGWME